MLNQIILNTPRWVWVLLLALLWLGLSQTRARSASLQRITVLPLVMTGLSLYGCLASFDSGAALLVWLVAGMLAVTWVLPQELPEATRYDAAMRRFSLPGSWLPLALIMGLFLTKYFVGVVTALQPGLRGDPVFAFGFSVLYGAFSGVFVARAARLWRLASQQGSVAAPAIAQSA